MYPEQQLTVDTPEQIALHLPLAGVGSRFLAVAVDTVLQAFLYVAAIVGVGFVGSLFRTAAWRTVLALGPAVSILLGFCIYWGYFAVFEIVWNGQTPGKRVTGLRVIKESGRPINAYEAIARNVLRAIDFLPALYAVGVVVMILDRCSRRLGDYVAGTIVVYDKTGTALPDLPRRASDAPAAPITQLTPEELGLIEAYLLRRADLDPIVRDEMAGRIVERVARRTDIRIGPDQSRDEFLETIASRARDAARLR